MRTHFDFALTPEQFIKAVKRNHQRLMRILPTRWLIQFFYVALVAALAFMLVYTSRLLQGIEIIEVGVSPPQSIT